MKMFVLALASLTAAAGFGSVSAKSKPASSRAKHGGMVFQQHCFSCHNKKPNDTAPYGPPNLARIFGERPLLTTEKAKNTIVQGKGVMPAFGGILGKTEIDDVLAYLKSQQVSTATKASSKP